MIKLKFAQVRPWHHQTEEKSSAGNSTREKAMCGCTHHGRRLRRPRKDTWSQVCQIPLPSIAVVSALAFSVEQSVAFSIAPLSAVSLHSRRVTRSRALSSEISQHRHSAIAGVASITAAKHSPFSTHILPRSLDRRGQGNDDARHGLWCSAISRGDAVASSGGVDADDDDPADEEKECFLAADGAEYCVTEPQQQQLLSSLPASTTQPPPLATASSSGVSSSLSPLETVAAVPGRRSLNGEGASAVGVSEGDTRVGIAGRDVDDGVSGSSSSSYGSGKSLYTMMGLCFLIAIVCALDRVAMSVAIVPMAELYGYTDTTKGLISSVFSWGYMASMVPSSVLIGVWGPKATMTAGVLAWSAAQMLSPTAAATSLQTLLACRFAMGLGEAVTLPSIQAIVAEWVPQDQRSRWLSLIISGLQIGTVLAYLASPSIIDTWKWQGVFLSYGALGLAWLALWLPLIPDGSPDSLTDGAVITADGSEKSLNRRGQQATTSGENRLATPAPITSTTTAAAVTAAGVATAAATAAVPTAVTAPGTDTVQVAGTTAAIPTLPVKIPSVQMEAFPGTENGDASAGGDQDGNRPSEKEQKVGFLGGFREVPWRQYATNGQIWSIASAHMSHNWGLYVMLAWLPTYFSQEFNLSLGESSGASVIPWVAGAVTGNMAGWGADALVNKNLLGVREVRKLFQTLALVGPAVCMLALAHGPESSGQASLLFTFVVALGSCSSAGFGSSVQDLKSKDTGVIYGMTSACSAVVGSLGTYLTGVVLDTTDSWALVFQATAAVYMIGACTYGLFYRAEPIVLKTGA